MYHLIAHGISNKVGPILPAQSLVEKFGVIR